MERYYYRYVIIYYVWDRLTNTIIASCETLEKAILVTDALNGSGRHKVGTYSQVPDMQCTTGVDMQTSTI